MSAGPPCIGTCWMSNGSGGWPSAPGPWASSSSPCNWCAAGACSTPACHGLPYPPRRMSSGYAWNSCFRASSCGGIDPRQVRCAGLPVQSRPNDPGRAILCRGLPIPVVRRSTMDQSLNFNRALVEKYDRPGPRYTSYPTAPQFHSAFAVDDYQSAARASNLMAGPKSLSVYIHIPFCKSLCYYCACNKIIPQKTHRAVEYLTYLKREIAMQAALFDGTRKLTQLHLGGGTPTYLTSEQ